MAGFFNIVVITGALMGRIGSKATGKRTPILVPVKWKPSGQKP